MSSYVIGFLGMLYDKLPCTCEGWASVFALLIVMVTFFFITVPHAAGNISKIRRKSKVRKLLLQLKKEKGGKNNGR